MAAPSAVASQPQASPVSGSGGGAFRLLAHYSWVSSILMVVASMALLGIKTTSWEESSRLAVDLALWFLRISGILCGMVALGGIRRHGRKGILIPAMVGLVLWSVSLGLGVLANKEIQESITRLKASVSSSVAAPGSSAAPDSAPQPVPTSQTPPVYATGSTRVEDTELGFSFAVPEGYSVAAEKHADDRHAFRRKLMTEPTRGIVIRIFTGGLSGRTATAADFPAPPPGHTLTALTFDWRGREVGGTRSLDPRLAKPFVVFHIAVPLRKQTLLLEISGAEESEAVIREVVQQVLASLDGESG